jgi:NADPH:quinone reductase-like Zn-dependent oxidoreductase
MDEDITFLKPKNVTLEQAATLGAGTLVCIR